MMLYCNFLSHFNNLLLFFLTETNHESNILLIRWHNNGASMSQLNTAITGFCETVGESGFPCCMKK